MPTRIIARTVAAAALILTLPLAGCSKKSANGNGDASGQILPGSASDAMLPEDRITSQPPLDPRSVRTGPAAPGEEEAAAPEASAAPAEPAATNDAE